MTEKKRFDMDAFLSGKTPPPEITERVQSEHGETTERIRKPEHFEKYKDSRFDVLTIRLLPEDIRRLRLYFDKRGVPLSQGIRTIVKDFMERQGI